MQLDNFLISIFFDALEIKYVDEEKSLEEFDKIFQDSNGKFMDEEAIFKIKGQYFFDLDIFDSIYHIIIESKDVSGTPDFDVLISYLITKYVIHNYNDIVFKDDIDFVTNNDLSTIKARFMYDYEFRIDLISSYYHSYINDKKYLANRCSMLKNNNLNIIDKFYDKKESMNTILRNVICDLYNHYILNGQTDIQALNLTWLYLAKNFDPLQILDKKGIEGINKLIYNRYLLYLIYADVYEDICNDSLVDYEYIDDRIATIIPVISVMLGNISIPKNERMRNIILKHFILLQDEKEKMLENRIKTYEDERIPVLRKLNPYYENDEI